MSSRFFPSSDDDSDDDFRTSRKRKQLKHSAIPSAATAPPPPPSVAPPPPPPSVPPSPPPPPLPPPSIANATTTNDTIVTNASPSTNQPTLPFASPPKPLSRSSSIQPTSTSSTPSKPLIKSPPPIKQPPKQTQFSAPANYITKTSPRCTCNLFTKELTVKKESANKGRKFFACANEREQQCNFFEWGEVWREKDYKLFLEMESLDKNGEVLTVKRKRVEVNVDYGGSDDSGEVEIMPRHEAASDLSYVVDFCFNLAGRLQSDVNGNGNDNEGPVNCSWCREIKHESGSGSGNERTMFLFVDTVYTPPPATTTETNTNSNNLDDHVTCKISLLTPLPHNQNGEAYYFSSILTNDVLNTHVGNLGIDFMSTDVGEMAGIFAEGVCFGDCFVDFDSSSSSSEGGGGEEGCKKSIKLMLNYSMLSDSSTLTLVHTPSTGTISKALYAQLSRHLRKEYRVENDDKVVRERFNRMVGVWDDGRVKVKENENEESQDVDVSDNREEKGSERAIKVKVAAPIEAKQSVVVKKGGRRRGKVTIG